MVYGPGGPASALARAKTMQGVSLVERRLRRPLLTEEQKKELVDCVRELLEKYAEDRREDE